MDTDFTSVTWEEAIKGFILRLQAVRAPKTVLFYKIQLANLVRWAEKNQIPLDHFGNRPPP